MDLTSAHQGYKQGFPQPGMMYYNSHQFPYQDQYQNCQFQGGFVHEQYHPLQFLPEVVPQECYRYQDPYQLPTCSYYEGGWAEYAPFVELNSRRGGPIDQYSMNQRVFPSTMMQGQRYIPGQTCYLEGQWQTPFSEGQGDAPSYSGHGQHPQKDASNTALRGSVSKYKFKGNRSVTNYRSYSKSNNRQRNSPQFDGRNVRKFTSSKTFVNSALIGPSKQQALNLTSDVDWPALTGPTENPFILGNTIFENTRKTAEVHVHVVEDKEVKKEEIEEGRYIETKHLEDEEQIIECFTAMKINPDTASATFASCSDKPVKQIEKIHREERKRDLILTSAIRDPVNVSTSTKPLIKKQSEYTNLFKNLIHVKEFVPAHKRAQEIQMELQQPPGPQAKLQQRIPDNSSKLAVPHSLEATTEVSKNIDPAIIDLFKFKPLVLRKDYNEFSFRAYKEEMTAAYSDIRKAMIEYGRLIPVFQSFRVSADDGLFKMECTKKT